MRKVLFLLSTVISLVQYNYGQTLNPTASLQAANSADSFKGGFTFAYAASGTPWNGSLISFGGFANEYDTQISADYGPNGGNHISFRTRNGDYNLGLGIWNPWIELATKSSNTFSGDQVVNGGITSSISSNEGGFISLENLLKTANDVASTWKIYNMTGNYGNSLQFWSYSQNGSSHGSKMTLSDNGNVGIGTANPGNKLTIQASHLDANILLHSTGDDINEGNQANLMLWASEPHLTYTGVGIGNNVKNWNAATGTGGISQISNTRGGSYIRLLDNGMNFNLVSASGTDQSVLTLKDNGNVGIGTANPLSKLDLGNNYSDPSPSPNKISLWNGGSNNYFGLGISNASFDYFSQGQHRFFVGYNGVPGREVFTVKASGNAALQGKFEAKEIKVTTTPTADFVFANDYKLPTLESVEKHIKEKKHLPEIASAAAMEKEGVNIGEFQIKLLQKIEELTLYTIEQHKEMNLLKEKVKKLEKNKK